MSSLYPNFVEHVAKLVGAAFLLALTAGCAEVAPELRSNFTKSDRVIYVQGTSGYLALGAEEVKQAFLAADCPVQLVTCRWHASRPPGYFTVSLEEYELVQKGAQSLADGIIAFKRTYPDARVSILAASAGCEVSRLALELLPEEIKVDNVVFAAAASSPGVHLEEALRAIKGRLYYFRSSFDWVFLGLGACVVGTTDRHFGPAAGMVGFAPPKNISAEEQSLYREKLVEVPWEAKFIQYGYLGEHMTVLSPHFVSACILPMLSGQWSSE